MKRKIWDDSSLLCQRGFTLIELLVVMIIISMLAALVGPRVFKKLGKAKMQAAEGQIHLFEMALDTYRLDTGHYPERLEDLVNRPGGSDFWDGPYLKKGIPKDPWGNDYHYAKSGEEYVLQSYGADGQPGGEGENADIPKGDDMQTRTVVSPGEY
ncbi:type II secretion system major pseudopilin GspG [bacterium]|nr:type II secretion system major pseudopilin GspG [bacterium]